MTAFGGPTGQATLTTPRLLLVPLSDEHLEHEVELDADPEVMRYLAAGPSSRATTEQAHRDRLAQAGTVPGTGLWAGLHQERFVGWWLLRPRQPVPVSGELELGYRLLRRFWCRGLAREGGCELVRHAFEDLGATRVVADSMAANQASRATMSSIGLQFVRAFRGDRDPSRVGADEGDVEYAITRDRWTAARRP